MVNGIPRPEVSFVALSDISDWMLLLTDYLRELSWTKLAWMAHLVEHWHMKPKVQGTLGVNISHSVGIEIK